MPPPKEQDRQWFSDFVQPVEEDIEILQKVASTAGSAALRQCRYLRGVHSRLATQQKPSKTMNWLKNKGADECKGCPVQKRMACPKCNRHYVREDAKCTWHPNTPLVALKQPYKWCLEVADDRVTHHMQQYLKKMPQKYLMSPVYLTDLLADREVPEIDIYEEEARVIILQKRRIQARINVEIGMPYMIEQIGKEMERLQRMLSRHLETGIQLGIIKGQLKPGPTMVQQNVLANQVIFPGSADSEVPIETLMQRNPNAIEAVVAALRVIDQAIKPRKGLADVEEGEAIDVQYREADGGAGVHDAGAEGQGRSGGAAAPAAAGRESDGGAVRPETDDGAEEPID